jgi:hypothetical protein
MDLRLFAQVIWRFRVIFACGVVAAFLLAALSMVRVQGTKLTYRQSQVYQSDALLAVTAPGFPFGPTVPLPGQQDPGGRVTQLAQIYATLAQDDAVQRQIPVGGFDRIVTATQLTDASGRNGLPFITVSGASTNASDAVRTAHRGAEILIQYINRLSAGTPARERADVRIATDAGKPKVIQPRKKTVPIFIFLVVLIATIGLILVLENMRPQAPTQTAVPLHGDKASGAAEAEKKKTAGSGDAS